MGKLLFSIDSSKCSLCFSCVRSCPVKAISINTKDSSASVEHNKCIECGDCYRNCPDSAISYISDISLVTDLLKSDANCVAIVAPSASAEFREIQDYRNFVQMLRELGFDHVNEMSFGVDVIAEKYLHLLNDFKGKYYLSANCPVTINYVEKYHPDLITNLAPIPSPMMMGYAIARETYGDQVKVVYIGPCVAAKNEGKRYDNKYQADAVITFEELRELFKQNGISEKQVEYSEFDSPLGNLGALFSVGDGFLEANNIDRSLISGDVVTVNGKRDFLDAINHFEQQAERIRKDFNIYYCDGCVMGPGTSPKGKKYVRRSDVIQYVKKRIKQLNLKQWQLDLKRYEHLEFKPSFSNDNQRTSISEKDVQRMLLHIGKEYVKDYQGCGACGYGSCHAFAKGICEGMAEAEMCTAQSAFKKGEYKTHLIAQREEIGRVEQLLRKTDALILEERESAKESHETILSLLHELPSAVVIVDHDMKVLQSNRNFLKTVGFAAAQEDTILEGLRGADIKKLLPLHIHKLFYYVMEYNENIMNRDIYINDRFFNVSIFTIKKAEVVGCILRDMYLPEVQKEQVISRINEVIGINFSMVQDIGALLGDSASETEQMLNSIVESYRKKDRI